jgi:hypothetical protein
MGSSPFEQRKPGDRKPGDKRDSLNYASLLKRIRSVQADPFFLVHKELNFLTVILYAFSQSIRLFVSLWRCGHTVEIA